MADSHNKLALIQDDPWLEPYEAEVNDRWLRYIQKSDSIKQAYGSLENFASAYLYFGLNYDSTHRGWWYREWAPGAYALFLIGDFNQWDRTTHPLKQNEQGIWEIFVPDEGENNPIKHEDLIKVHVVSGIGAYDRIPAYIRRAFQHPQTYDFSGQAWMPAHNFEWTDEQFSPSSTESPVIYECHIGMGQEDERVGTYVEFADKVLPRIQRLGYNCIQMMAIQEHPYYGSFGYHVSNFFAPTSRFGTPDELKYLVNKAHGLGLTVIMDIVHSHAVKNFAEGLNQFDGTDEQYFHPGGRGYHSSWDSKLFNYGKEEVLQFLLSNVAYWIKEFHFDGFRFDGVTSMLYFHHGDFIQFGHYDKYFRDQVEWDAITYLQLANDLAHAIKPEAITIAEDMSGMPGLCRKLDEGGIGFDYRLGMGIPDYWIKLLKHSKDEEWDIHEMWHVMSNRRLKEKTVAYSESHDQALVGDKTLAFWLMDKEMYWHMQVGDDNVIIERGIALLKIIRLFTCVLGGEAYLNFMGNEFGHPEWIDFPREGNGWSYKYARRQWSLADRDDLKYKYLANFDREMIGLVKQYQVLSALPAQQVYMDPHNKVVVAERNNLVFVWNFHPGLSLFDYKIWVPNPGKYKIVLCSDDANFGGHNRIDTSIRHFTDIEGKLSLYCTNRTALVLRREE